MITRPGGFTAAGGHAGIKADGAPDLALVVADAPAVAAAVFTSNRAAAAPVDLSRRHVADGVARAVVVNSGCANAGTGSEGRANARRMAERTAAAVGCDPTEVVVCSTGPIGPHLPIDSVELGIGRVAQGLAGGSDAAKEAARAILTTDTYPKTSHVVVDRWAVGAIAKGAAMCRPDMATMLAVITTDAQLTPAELDASLRTAVGPTFNSLNIDGCTSTNDTVVALASGVSGVRPDPAAFTDALTSVCESLARQMARDGEETSKVVDVVVSGAIDDAAAREVGLAITDSDLVRSSFYGGDPNWGRVLQAIGTVDTPFDDAALEIRYDGVVVATAGVAGPYDRDALLPRLSGDFTLEVDLGSGDGSARIIAADLTPGYVEFNGAPS